MTMPTERGSEIVRGVFSTAPCWYVVHTKPRQEARLISQLTVRAPEIKPFLPKIEVIRRHAGYRIALLEPLFPNYVFLWMALEPRTWNAVRWTPGAMRLLGDSDRPLPVPDEVIAAIRSRVEPLGFVRVGLDLAPGARVRVRAGPFAGLEAIFEGATSRRDRVRILMEILGSVRPLEMDPLDLERV
jgi:transcriptional antiterminator RfaH